MILVSFMLLAQLSFTGLFVKAEETDTNALNINNQLLNAYNTASKFMVESVPIPSFGNEWYIFSLARGAANGTENYFETYYTNLEKFVKSKNGILHQSKYTEYSRVILALNAIGKDPTNVGGYNLVEKLFDLENVKKQGINGPIFALIAIDTNQYRIPPTADNSRQKMIDFIINQQLNDGGWALGSKIGDADVTAMAIQALSTYTNQAAVKDAVDKALVFLSSTQLDNGGYKSWGTENVESASQVLVALTSLGIDPSADSRFIKPNGNILSNIMTFYSEKDGGFKHILTEDKANSMATEQVSYAIAAYFRYVNNQTKLYDMTDKKPTIALTVDPVTTTSTKITGKTDAGVTVTAKTNNVAIGSTTSNSDGTFSINITPQNADTIINIFAEGGNKIPSAIVTVKVNNDTGKPDPSIPTELVVNPVNDKSTQVTGKAEAGATVELYIEDKLTQSTKADTNGNYSFTISPQKAGVKITVKAIGPSGKSDSKTVTVEDITPPSITVKPVTDKSTEVTGTTEAEAKVELYLDDTLAQTKTADSNGNFSFTISKQKAGVKIKVIATDQAGNSEVKTIIVEDKTPPSLTINQVSDKSTKITGKTEAEANVKLYINEILQQIKIADSKGNYSFNIIKQKPGVKIKIIASDKVGNTTSKTITVVDKTPPSLTVSQVSDKSTKVTGKTEAKATVKLYINGKLKQTKTADSKGNYSLTISKQKAGVKIKVVASDKAGNSTSKTFTVLDKTPPAKPTVKKVTIASKDVTGKTEANTTVFVYKGKTKLGSTKASSKGIYKVTIKKQKAGIKLSVFAKDKAGNKSKSTYIKVSKK
ncbi:Ig-like domain-containing protein [Heyndrickxia sp. NPDC080065]|uniref:Ig-like domain-containing protein n=1 Tax=Heyndrickxia sp. NPDC080065 TaxID=3390568 RepID=UPI003CFF5A50